MSDSAARLSPRVKSWWAEFRDKFEIVQIVMIHRKNRTRALRCRDCGLVFAGRAMSTLATDHVCEPERTG